MKFICLHGYGTSGDIFQQQLGSIIRTLGDHHEFHFLDGEVVVSKTELAGLLTGKTLAYYAGHRSQDVQLAQELLEETLAAEEIPFDGVIGFSQGASLAISYVLQQQILHPDRNPPFRVGIFFTPGFVISPDPDYNKETFAAIHSLLGQADHETIFATLFEKTSKVVAYNPAEDFPELQKVPLREREVVWELLKNGRASLQIKSLLGVEEGMRPGDDRDESQAREMLPRFFNPIYTPQRVPFPTVHVTGDRDPAPDTLAKYAYNLCAPNTVMSISTQGGHEIPTKKQDVDNVARAIEKAMYLGQKMW